MPEYFVDKIVAAQHLGVNPEYLLDLARRKIIPAYPISLGSKRFKWRFRLSELDAAMANIAKTHVHLPSRSRARMKEPKAVLGNVPVTKER